jgi:hypothetical protein
MKHKRIFLLSISVLTLFSCSQTDDNKSEATDQQTVEVNSADNSTAIKESNNQTDPAWVVNQIFEAAKSSEYESLLKLCDPEGEGDGDTRQICSIYSAPKEAKNEFNSYFKFGQIIGKPVIVGNQAKVQIKFGPDGDRDETMDLIQRDGKWYLSSF